VTAQSQNDLLQIASQGEAKRTSDLVALSVREVHATEQEEALDLKG
jgi:hypothetical protein